MLSHRAFGGLARSRQAALKPGRRRYNAPVTRRELVAALLAGPIPIGAWQVAGAPDDGLTSLTAEVMAGRVASRDLSADALTEAHLARIARLNATLGAFVTVTAERARADARRGRPGLLRGVPVAHKDLFETAGIRTTAGSRLFGAHVPARDAAVVRRLSDAGAASRRSIRSTARRGTPSIHRALPAGRAADRPQRSPRISCRSRPAATRAGACAFRLRSAAWSVSNRRSGASTRPASSARARHSIMPA
jgi:hypothetical protein